MIPDPGRHSRWSARDAGAEQGGGDEVDGRLAPAGALHTAHPAPLDHQRRYGRPLVVAQPCALAGEPAQHGLRAIAHRFSARIRHAACLSAATDKTCSDGVWTSAKCGSVTAMTRTIAEKLQSKPNTTVWLSDPARLPLLTPMPDGVREADAMATASTAVLF